MYYTENDFRLYHHGIKGQKWGIRRYQNPDGTLTEEGKRRYEKLRKNIGTSEKVGSVVGAVAGGTAAVGANVAFTLATGVIWPYGQITLTAAAAMTSGAAAGEFMRKHAEKKLSSFQKDLERDREGAVKRMNDAQDKLQENLIKNTPDATKEERAGQKRIHEQNKKFTTEYMNKRIASQTNDERLANSAAILKSQKSTLMKNAREKGTYDIEFLEAVQNTGKMGDKKWMQSEYSKYLDDPEKYWRGEVDLPQE